MCQKCEGNCGLWVLNEIIKTIYPENLKKIVGAVVFSFKIIKIYLLNYFFKNPQTTITLTFLTHIISAIGGMN